MEKSDNKSFWKRINDPMNTLGRQEFILCYFGWLVITVVLGSIFVSLIGDKSATAVAMGFMYGFFMIFGQRLRYFGLSKWWGLLAFPVLTNPIIFLYLAIRSK